MKVKNRVIKRGCFVPGEEECCLGKRKVSPGRPQWSELEKRPVLPQPNTMQVPQQLPYFLTCEIHRSIGKFQSCCLCIQASGYEEEKADVSCLVKGVSAL